MIRLSNHSLVVFMAFVWIYRISKLRADDERKECHVAGKFNLAREFPLMFTADAGSPSRKYFSALGNIPIEDHAVFVVRYGFVFTKRTVGSYRSRASDGAIGSWHKILFKTVCHQD